ncbi:hypothetical protein PV325_009056 [Microctonus aethiopoides]|uniref:Uncharacterized protein n=1 Tax=Microctonus aethiopoides TaxID=144406 RepID=A0AA39FU02_9HYME|nr:hypothetical protein PV325_009056 [Microctonus aethiopoides]KAK0095978.1 hypothetical protein PV326_006877 [Microctonus aethiopoides]KAK0175814.1 hypothetical protein PV328_000016 [Microctonus aethiopoides]
MFEIEEETRDFLTINQKDFDKKKIQKVKKYVASSYYVASYNAINGPYREYLYNIRNKSNFSAEKEANNISEYLKKIYRQKIDSRNLLSIEKLISDVIEGKKKNQSKSIYQSDYFKEFDDTLLLYGKLIDNNNVRMPLPDNWIVPETIYNKSYRNIQRKFKVEESFRS